MALAGAAVQKAVYDRLRLAPTLIALVGSDKVYDAVPPGVAAPYIAIGDDVDVESNDDLLDEHGTSQTMTLHVWTETHRGRLAAKQVLSVLHDILCTDLPLVIEGWQVLGTVFEGAGVAQEEDGLTYHGVFRLRVRAQEMRAGYE